MRSATLSLLTILFATLSYTGNAQQETKSSNVVEASPSDTSAWPSWRVLVAGEALLLASVWTDSLWQWSDQCDGPFVTLRFEADSSYRERVMPCDSPIESDSLGAALKEYNREMNAPLSADSADLPLYAIEVQLHRAQLDSLPNYPLLGSCFPLISEQAFQRWFNAINALTFESDKCRAIDSRQHRSCLTSNQAIQLLHLIPSEDRRLLILKGLAPHTNLIQQLPLDDLFHLQVFRTKAEEMLR
jgi:hypothetical protein